MSITPQSVLLGPRADKELVIVVCTDADGNTHNEYIRDAGLKQRYDAEPTGRDKADADDIAVTKALAQIDLRANPPTPADDRNE